MRKRGSSCAALCGTESPVRIQVASAVPSTKRKARLWARSRSERRRLKCVDIALDVGSDAAALSSWADAAALFQRKSGDAAADIDWSVKFQFTRAAGAAVARLGQPDVLLAAAPDAPLDLFQEEDDAKAGLAALPRRAVVAHV